MFNMQYPTQSDTSFEEINQLIWKHLEERDWLGGTPRNYATSILLEASELLEHYQWSDKPVGDKEALASELADILIYCFEFAMHTDIDMAAAIKQKLAKAAEKYPAAAFKGKVGDEKQTAWIAAKEKHNATKKGL
jgi:dCTP diphosphatase